MPVATSSRQKSNGQSSRRRGPSSDDIEEARASQLQIASGEDEEPKRKGRKGNLAKVMDSEAEESGDEDGEPEDSCIDINNFKDQPLIKTEAGKIKGVASDWENIRTQSQNTVKGLMDNVGTSLADLMPPDEAEKVSLWLKSIVSIAQSGAILYIGSQRTGHIYERDSRYRRGNALP